MGLFSDKKDELKLVSANFKEKQKQWEALYTGNDNSYKIKYTIQGKEKDRVMRSLKLPKLVSHKMSSLICNEKLQLHFENDKTWDSIKPILEHTNFIMNLQEASEYMFALGGMATECFFDSSTNQVEINYIKATDIEPLSWAANGRLKECVLKIEEQKRDNSIYTLYRRHEFIDGVYTISNELYMRSAYDKETKGKPIELTALYQNIEPVIQFEDTEINYPFFAYCKPNIANNIEINERLGISIYANAIDTIYAIDTIFDSYIREFKLGKKRVVVPRSWLRFDNDNHNAYFDTDDEVFYGMGGMDSGNLHDINVNLRVSEHIEAINEGLELLAAQVGLSAGTFSFDGVSVKTATEVVSVNSDTFRTKRSHEQRIEEFIKQTIKAACVLANYFMDGFSVDEELGLSVVFDDSITDDIATTIQQEIAKVNSGIQSKKRAIMKIEGVGEDEAEKILKGIISENQTITPDITDLVGGGS